MTLFDGHPFDLTGLELVDELAVGDLGRLGLTLAEHGDEQQDHHQDDHPESHVPVKLLALAWKIAQSNRVDRVFCAPGNAGTAEDVENVAVDSDDFSALIEFSKQNQIDLVVVGPEQPLCMNFCIFVVCYDMW